MNEYDEHDIDEKINALIGYKEKIQEDQIVDEIDLQKPDRVLLLHLFGHKLYYNRARFHEIISH